MADQIPRIVRRALKILTLAAAVMGCSSVAAGGLRDIHPRPQQMGSLADEPLAIPGTFYLVIPDNPTSDEIYVRDEALERIAERVSRVPIVIHWSQFTGQTPALLMGTDERMPALVGALDTVGIAGLGLLTHGEEYELYVDADRMLLCGNDLRGVRWGLMSLIELMSEADGVMYVDRAYIRDWPDLPQRIVAINGPLRNAEQNDYVNQIADLGYRAKLNEIEWNEHDGGRDMAPYPLALTIAFRDKVRSRGQAMTLSADRTGVTVDQAQYQEGIPMSGTRMRVDGSGVLNVIPSGFNISVLNPGFESWTDGLPTSWSVYQPSYTTWIAQDQVIRHSGNSSAKFFNLSSAPADLDLRRFYTVVGAHRYLHVKFWYRLANFSGVVRVRLHGPPPVTGKMDERFLEFATSTTQDWTLQEFNFTTGYMDSAAVFLGILDQCNGTVWFDDVTIESGTIENVVKRPDTPLNMYKLPTNLPMEEGLDFQITETSGFVDENFYTAPRFTRLASGRLAPGDSVSVDWHGAPLYQTSRRTVCFSLTEPLLAYQERVRRMDSLMHPDGFKIHINEVCYSDYDQRCTSRGLTPGQLVGDYCHQMYNIIQSYRPGAPVRIYGDPVDIWVPDPRLQPVTTPPWTAGVLQELPPAMQIMAMNDYSTNLDSSLAYFQANGHTSIVSGDRRGGVPKFVRAALGARRWPGTVRGMMFYEWGMDVYQALVPSLGDVAWNLGPYISHRPVVFASQPSNVTIRTEMWTDSFQTGEAPVLTSKQLHYRLLPSGQWTTVNLNTEGTDTYSATLDLSGPGVTGIAYYLMTTDYRGQTRYAPPDAPAEAFVAMFPGQSERTELNPEYHELPYVVSSITGHYALAWDTLTGADHYEVHYGNPPQFDTNSPTLLTNQQSTCPRYLISDESLGDIELSQVHVYAVMLPPHSTADPRKRR